MLDKLQSDLKTAMIARDKIRVDTLKSIKTALTNERIKKSAELTTEEELSTVQREAKKRKESIELYTKAGRTVQAEAEQRELEIIEEYLPNQLSDSELVEYAQAAIAELGITGPQDMGRAMGHLSAKLKGQADNAKLAKIVKELLGGQRS